MELRSHAAGNAKDADTRQLSCIPHNNSWTTSWNSARQSFACDQDKVRKTGANDLSIVARLTKFQQAFKYLRGRHAVNARQSRSRQNTIIRGQAQINQLVLGQKDCADIRALLLLLFVPISIRPISKA